MDPSANPSDRVPLLQQSQSQSFLIQQSEAHLLLQQSLLSENEKKLPRVGSRLDTLAHSPQASPTHSTTSQSIFVDDDLIFSISPKILSKSHLYSTLSVISLALFPLLCRWFPSLSIASQTLPSTLDKADVLVVENQWKQVDIQAVRRVEMHLGLGWVFPRKDLALDKGLEIGIVDGDAIINAGEMLDSAKWQSGNGNVTLTDSTQPNLKNKTEELILIHAHTQDDEESEGSFLEIKSKTVSFNPTVTTLQRPYIAKKEISERKEMLIYFEYRHFRFIFNPYKGMYEGNYGWRDPCWDNITDILNGKDTLSHIQIEQRLALFGPNIVDIGEKSTFRLLVDEVLHPFFIFQICSIILWSVDSYYYYAFCILLITVVSTFITLKETKLNLSRLKSLSKFSCKVRLWRSGKWTYAKSDAMVPGDIFEIESGQLLILPCDAVLLEGDCIVNESMLTGESTTVSKQSIPESELSLLNFDLEEPATSPRMGSYFLFSGTKIIRVRHANIDSPHYNPSSSKRGAIALVVRTGFNTAKGSLIRNMLFPRPNQFKFYQDSFRFIGVLAIISGLGFLGSVYNFIRLHVDWGTILMRALDLITIAVPPALPATMAIGTTFAISRLRKSQIFCTSPPRVNICGKINIMCFDKTGTLTDEGLDVLGVRYTLPVESIEDVPIGHRLNTYTLLRFSRMYKQVESLLPKPFIIPASDLPVLVDTRSPALNTSHAISGVSLFLANQPSHPTAEPDFPYPLLVCAMAACHSIKVVKGVLMGDPLDLKMFEFTDWHIEEDLEPRKLLRLMVVRPPWVPDYGTITKGYHSEDETFTEVEVMKAYEFVSTLRRMSVISRRNHYSRNSASDVSHFKDFDVFCKGAPEAVTSICLPESCINALI